MDKKSDSWFEVETSSDQDSKVIQSVQNVLDMNKKNHRRKVLWSIWLPLVSTVSLSIFGTILLFKKSRSALDGHESNQTKLDHELDFKSFIVEDLDQESLELADNMDILENLDFLENYSDEES